MNKIDRQLSFTYKGKVYTKSGNDQYDSYKARIEHKGKEMDLTKEQFEFLTSQPCSYCGIDGIKMGVDRVDNTKGYSLTNAVPACGKCNMMKLTGTLEDFLSHIERIYKYQQENKL